MERKYYDLIIDLVKQHKKFQNFESILDDIVDDVYKHANVVIDTIDDEAVLSAYLAKIVSTSMITVPKRFNLSTRTSSKIEEVLQAIENKQSVTKIEPEIVNDSENDDKVVEELAEFYEEVDTLNNFEENYSNEQDLVELEDSYTEEVVVTEKAEVIEELTESENVAELDLTNNIEAAVEQELTVDQSLVEMMINGVPSNEPEIEAEDFDIEEDIPDSDYDELEELEILDETPSEVENLVADSNEEQIIDEDAEMIAEGLEDVVDLEASEAVEIEADLLQENSAENDDFIEIDEPEALLSDFAEIEEPLSIDNVNTNIFDDRFSCFEYTPQLNNFNSDEICEILLKLNKEYPDKNILKICELKYYQNKTVTEISEILSVSNETVLEALGYIIEAIKD
ncbi:MAG: hypothetical protein E7Z92_05020 [Cyanobacteria bacterium SIG31]|nr:hypothetical protein [Cyanobacteria bacterium SIG31]